MYPGCDPALNQAWYSLFVPELAVFRLCSNGDQGLISLFHQCILPLPFPSKRTMGDNYVEEVPNTLFASAFGLDRRGEELPRPRAIRCFQGAMKSQRHNTFWEVFRTIVMLMEGTPFKRFLENLDVGMFTTPRAVEDMYQDHLQSHSLDPTFKLQTREQFKQQLFEFFGTDVNGDLRRRCSICAKPQDPPAKYLACTACKAVGKPVFSAQGNASSLVESRTGRIAASPSRTSPSRMPQ